jgi:hypothetical protein
LSLTLVWDRPAVGDMAAATEWSEGQARAVVEEMERMAARGFSLGRRTNRAGVRYWPVPPLGVFYRVSGDELRVVQVVDVRRLLGTPESLEPR